MADDAEIEELRADMKRWKGIAAAEAEGNEAHRRGWEAADLEIERLLHHQKELERAVDQEKSEVARLNVVLATIIEFYDGEHGMDNEQSKLARAALGIVEQNTTERK